MPYIPPINTGLLSDVVNNITNLVPDLPGPFDNRIKDAVNTAVDVVDPTTPTQEPPKPPVVVPPDSSPEQKNDIVRALDTVISALGVVLKMGFLIPDQYERPLELLVKALEKVRGWVD